MKGGIRGEKPLTSEFGRPNSVLAATQDSSLAATQDCCLVLGVGYDCSYITGRKEKAGGHRSWPQLF